MPSKLTVSYT